MKMEDIIKVMEESLTVSVDWDWLENNGLLSRRGVLVSRFVKKNV